MDHDTANCPTGGSTGKTGKSKGRGKGPKGVQRPRRYGFWAMTTLVCAVPACVNFVGQLTAAGELADSAA
eukprot:426763-Pyramimonas_sp.AAC.1